MTDFLEEFTPIKLSEMDNVKLMNRVDTKYLFHKNRLPALIALIKHNYRILEIEGKRLMTYDNVYFDTPDFKMYYAHHNGKQNRYKIRIREYVESELSFTEIKFKNNKGKTKKKRFITNNLTPKESDLFIKEHSPFAFDTIEQKLYINFNRFTLVHKTKKERATIDMNLHLKKDNKEQLLENLIIAEIKQESYQNNSEIIQALKRLGIRKQRMSKYCIGIAALYKNIKQNNFKPRIRKISKIESKIGE